MARAKGAKYPSDEARNERRRREKEKIAAKAAAPPTGKRPVGRPPKARAGKPVPSLESIAYATVPELSGQRLGGVCPACEAPHDDIDRNCRKCGEFVRRACVKCGRTVDNDETRYCTGCGEEIPEVRSFSTNPTYKAAEHDDAGGYNKESPTAASPSVALAPVTADEPNPWDPDDVGFFAAGVSAMLVKMGSPALTEREMEKIDKRTAVMANKWLRPQGKWKEEILWGAAWVPPLAMAMWIRYVVAPDRAAAAAAKTASALESKPNTDGGRTVDGGGAPGEHPPPRSVPNLESV